MSTYFDWRHPNYAPLWAERAKRLEKLRAEPELLPALREFYKTHPAKFITDWCVTFDPRNPEIGLPALMPFTLFPKQEEAVQWLLDGWRGREDGLIEKSRDMGLSWLCMAFAVWMWTFHEGVVVGFGSRKEDYVDKIGDPSSLFWKGRMLIDKLPAEFKPAGYDEKKHAPFMRLLNPENGSAIVGEAGDNIGRGGRTSVYFKDESAFYEHPDAVDAALSQTSNCKIDLSTPNGEGNPFWRKRHGGKIRVFVFDWRDDPRKDAAWYEKQRSTLDPSILAQEVDRDYSASIQNSFIPGGAVTVAQAVGPADVPAVGNIRVGVDVARFGDDKTCVSIRRGRVLIKQIAWGKMDLMSTAGRVKAELQAYAGHPGFHIEQIAVDTIGVGAGVADALRAWFPDTKEGKLVVDVNSSIRMDDGENYNLRSFMWSQMKDWVVAGASLPNDHELRADLTGLRYLYKGGLLLIESKDDAKKRGLKSPDRADSLALTFAIPQGVKQRPTVPANRVKRYTADAETGI
jgi:phage terminase large subunit